MSQIIDHTVDYPVGTMIRLPDGVVVEVVECTAKKAFDMCAGCHIGLKYCVTMFCCGDRGDGKIVNFRKVADED